MKADYFFWSPFWAGCRLLWIFQYGIRYGHLKKIKHSPKKFHLKKQKISVKGISYPVQTYEVLRFANKKSKNNSIFEKSIPGLSMSLDKSAIEDNETAISLINDALKSLQSD